MIIKEILYALVKGMTEGIAIYLTFLLMKIIYNDRTSVKKQRGKILIHGGYVFRIFSVVNVVFLSILGRGLYMQNRGDLTEFEGARRVFIVTVDIILLIVCFVMWMLGIYLFMDTFITRFVIGRKTVTYRNFRGKTVKYHAGDITKIRSRAAFFGFEYVFYAGKKKVFAVPGYLHADKIVERFAEENEIDIW